MSVIALDVGGTKILGGVVENSKVSHKIKLKTKVRASKDKLNEQIVELIEKLMTDKVRRIGVAVPGIVDNHTGKILNAPNIKNWQNVRLGEIIGKQFGLPVSLINDANAFSWGELHYGQGRSLKNLVGITLGTGFGSGIVIAGKLYLGAHFGAGEFGNMTFREGVLEDYVSGKFFRKYYKSEAKELYILAGQGKKQASKAFREFAGNLAIALSIISRAVDPQMIVIGGSVAKAKKYFYPQMKKELNKLFKAKGVQSPRIKFSQSEETVLLGCAKFSR